MLSIFGPNCLGQTLQLCVSASVKERDGYTLDYTNRLPFIQTRAFPSVRELLSWTGMRSLIVAATCEILQCSVKLLCVNKLVAMARWIVSGQSSVC